MKLNIKAFALSLGIVVGLLFFVSTIWLLVRGLEPGTKVFLSHYYPFYDLSIRGSFLGLFYGFADGAITGALFAWLYNLLSSNNGQG